MGTVSERHLQVLHEDIVAALSRVLPELTAAGDLVADWSQNPRGTGEELVGLARNLADVRELELAMPIVAEMKAGKSSLINAIVGYELLPSRAQPMTTLPTKIILIDGMDLRRPELEIPGSLQDLYARAEKAISESLLGGWQVPEGHSYLGELAARIAIGDLRPLKRTYTGIEAVHDILARLNDQMRLLTFARPDLDLLGQVTDLPVLRTGSQHSYQSGDAMAGRLVIIDTPGPNEKSMALRLTEVLERQLAASHVVLIVLDYMHMNSDAAEDVRDLLDRHLAIIGPHRVFGVVNKVDARKTPADLSKEDTYESARITLGLTPEQAEGRIFETVAHWGAIGSRVIAELADRADGDFSTSTAMRALWKEVHPLDEGEEITLGLREATVGEIERDARKLLARSGISVLVETAIGRLRAGAGPTVMAVALDRFIAALTDLRELAELERGGTARSQAAVREQLANLEKEMALLAQMRAKRPDSEALRSRFSGSIEELIGILRLGAEQIIDTLDATERTDRSLPDRIQSMVRSAQARVTKSVWRDGKAADTREFPTLTEAEAFMDKMSDSVVSQLQPLLDYGRSEADRRISEMVATVEAEQEAQVHQLLERAAKVLEIAFDVKLTVPPVTLDTAVEVTLDRPATRTSSGSYTYTVKEKKRTWWSCGFKVSVDVEKHSSYSNTYFVVAKADVKTRIGHVFEGRLREIRQTLTKYLTDELEAKLDEYYDHSNQYLTRYHSALSRSQNVSRLDDRQKQEYLARLGALEKTCTAELRSLSDYREQVAGFENAAG